MALTRGKTSNPICHAGLATELPRNVLPKEIDIYNYLKFLQGQGQSLINIANSIAEEVVEIWTEKGNLPTITEQAVAKKVKEIHKRGKNFMKKPVQRRISTIHEPLEGVKSPNSRGRPRKTDNFEGLFDICTCNCASRNSCTCPSDKKVHEREWEFLVDQRTLIDYTRDAKPSLNKVKFIDYVQKVYVPAWFTFKMSCKLKDGAKNVFTMLQLLKTQPLDIQNIAKKYVQINAFFAHSSNLLVAMLAEEDDESIRKQAVDGIIEIRKNKEHSCVERTDSGLRLFKVPKLNWGAENYTQIIDWDLKDFCEPPITMKFSDDEIRRFYSVPMVIQNYPSQSQSVERAVKMVSDACKSAYGYEERHQLVLSTQAARKERQSYRTKEKFKRLERGMQKLKEPNM